MRLMYIDLVPDLTGHVYDNCLCQGLLHSFVMCVLIQRWNEAR